MVCVSVCHAAVSTAVRNGPAVWEQPHAEPFGERGWLIVRRALITGECWHLWEGAQPRPRVEDKRAARCLGSRAPEGESDGKMGWDPRGGKEGLSRVPCAVLGLGEAAVCGTRRSRGGARSYPSIQGQHCGEAASPWKNTRSRVNGSLAPAGCLIRVGSPPQ